MAADRPSSVWAASRLRAAASEADCCAWVRLSSKPASAWLAARAEPAAAWIDPLAESAIRCTRPTIGMPTATAATSSISPRAA